MAKIIPFPRPAKRQEYYGRSVPDTIALALHTHAAIMGALLGMATARCTKAVSESSDE